MLRILGFLNYINFFLHYWDIHKKYFFLQLILFGEFGRHTNDSEKYSARKRREMSFKFKTDVVPSPDRRRMSLRKVIL
jgi:hypothetical protein